MTGDHLKSCSKGDTGEKWNTYFPRRACKYKFCMIPSIIIDSLY